MKTRLNKGFTLIELLVVIAIIGILSGVVLASLNGARNKAKDASAKASMSAIRPSAEMYWDSYSTYELDASDAIANSRVCKDSEVVKLMDAAKIQTGNAAFCYDVPGAYLAYVKLNDGKYYCVDSTQTAKTVTAMPVAETTACL